MSTRPTQGVLRCRPDRDSGFCTAEPGVEVSVQLVTLPASAAAGRLVDPRDGPKGRGATYHVWMRWYWPGSARSSVVGSL